MNQKRFPTNKTRDIPPRYIRYTLKKNSKKRLQIN